MNKSDLSSYVNQKNSKVDDSFWNRYIELVRDEVIPYQYDALNDRIEGASKSYSIENFIKAGKIVKAIKSGEDVPVYPEDKWEYTDGNCDDNAFHGWVFQDSDLYKWLEAVGFSLGNKADEVLEKRADECIELIEAAQLDNGYLDTLYIINDRDKSFTNLRDKHELYCFGHLAEAAVSYYNATGKRKLLDIACRFADLICDTFNENGIKGYPGHEIAEMALVKLYNTTGNKKYIETAKFFIDERGRKPYYFDIEQGKNEVRTGEYYHYNQAHRQPIEQDEAVGHAVRGVYLYSGMADVAKAYGDDELFSACEKIWDNIENKKLYITGGIGATVDGEAFSFNYDLPNDLAYSETCASIGLMFFARRMLEIKPSSHYADVMERALYNTVLSGMAEDGKAFFYVNPLEVLPEASHKDSRKWHIKTVRQKWFGCACCPPNLARLISSLGEYCYTENEDTIFAHLFIGGELNTDKADIVTKSSYIYDGRVSYMINAKKPFTFAVRLPEHCDSFNISMPYDIKDGYAYIKVDESCELDIRFEMRAKLIKCSNLVRANTDKVAVMRGPVVYCAEEVDNGKNLQLLQIDCNTAFKHDGEYIIVDGFREKECDTLYSEYRKADCEKCKIKLLPYHRWGNRGENEMSVYLRIK